jgi:hypothetical protein
MRYLFKAFLVVMLISGLFGCMTTGTSSSGDPATVSSPGASEQYEEFVPYTEFDDIAVPNELSRVPDKTFIYENAEFKTGMIVMKGRVEVSSLIDFFVNQMAKDNWVKENSIISSVSTLVFKKPYKSCMIRVNDGTYNTEVEIYAVELKAEARAGSGAAGTGSFNEQSIQ